MSGRSAGSRPPSSRTVAPKESIGGRASDSRRRQSSANAGGSAPSKTHSRAPRSRRPRRKRKRGGRSKVFTALGVSLAVCLLLAVVGLRLWGHATVESAATPTFTRVEIAEAADPGHAVETLSALGLLRDARLARWYQRVWLPFFHVEPGVHWLAREQSAHEVLRQLGRRRDRAIKRVVLPEGWDSFQIAERLAAAGVCDAAAFLDAVHAKSSGSGASLEGYLYPATYEFRLNTSAAVVAKRLEREARRRFDSVFEQHPTPLTSLGQRLGLHRPQLVALASIVEKEAANRDEYGLVASVFLNRLSDPKFRPVKMLQSDPTAAYGCKVMPSLESCQNYNGRVTSSMLRDAHNPYNTYRYPGLPPTAIGNPSVAALAAVLTAPNTPYYFFVSPNGGPHQFSQTLEEHEGHFRPR